MALVTIERTQAQFPLGARGQRPVKFHVGPYVAKEMFDAKLPGVRVFSSDGVVACSWDYASSVAALLGLEKELPPIPLETAIPLPGIEEYKAKLKAGNRPHQPEAIRFLARRAWAYLADDMRSGKSRTAIAAATAIGAKRILVLTPNIAKFVWPREIYKWLGEQSLILEGRSGREARTWCIDCRGRGTRALAAFEEAVCASCKGVGDLPAHVRETAGPDPIELDEEEDGAWCSLWPALHRGCREHRHIRMHPVDGRWCAPCHEKLRTLMTTTRWTIANFDILVQQHERQGGGVVARRTDLAGWGGAGGPLRFARYDLVIIDEMHNLRGYDNKSYTQTRRARTERVYDAIFDIPRVWALSGTPTFGFTADLWPQLNILSKGLFGEKPWDFDVRYCASFKDVYGWNNEGRSPLADTELRDRLATVMIRRLTHEINPDQPGMDHQIVELEVPDKDLKSRDWGQSGRKAIETEVRRLSRLKWPAVAEAVCDEMINGRRTYVLTYHVKEAADLAKFIAEEMESRQRVRRLREVHAKLWLCHGELVAKDDKYRDRIAQEFVEHTGAGVFIATYDSMQGAISLLGANSIHEVDWHHSPAAQAQAERRVAEFEVRHLIPVLHYTIKKSIDVKLERQVLPKLETMSAIVRDRDAKNLMGSLLARREASADIGDQSLDFYAQLASDAVTLDLEGLDYKFDTHYEGDT
jgi:hypothetical protein